MPLLTFCVCVCVWTLVVHWLASKMGEEKLEFGVNVHWSLLCKLYGLLCGLFSWPYRHCSTCTSNPKGFSLGLQGPTDISNAICKGSELDFLAWTLISVLNFDQHNKIIFETVVFLSCLSHWRCYPSPYSSSSSSSYGQRDRWDAPVLYFDVRSSHDIGAFWKRPPVI